VGVLEFSAGFVMAAWILNDVFNTVILPRPSPARFRPSVLVTRWIWRAWRRYAEVRRDPDGRERRLGAFAPATVMILLGVWIALLIVGFSAMLLAFGDGVAPRLTDLGAAMYFAAISLLTIGYGDYVPTELGSRLVAVAAGTVGLGIVALTITYLFSLYASFQRREVAVVTLDARAGAPPSGITLLETCAGFESDGELEQIFESWEKWAAEVLESHLAYPVLLYFRSTHDHESWVSAIGAILDATTLLLTTVDGGPRSQSSATRAIGSHLVEDIWRSFRFAPGQGDEGPGIERPEFDDARSRLSAAGYALVGDADLAWAAFARSRAEYAGRLNALARFLDVPPAQWIGDRSYVLH
jgi:hypothetical protein